VPVSWRGAGRASSRAQETASAAGTVAAIDVGSLRKSFGSGKHQVVAVDNVSLSVAPGEVVALLGPSGCGKTTLLRCLAGLERPDAGSIELGGALVYSSQRRIYVPPERRRVSMMFQSYALWPHMTVSENVAYPLRSWGMRRAEIATQVTEMLKRVGCEALALRYPGQLSGGQQQRVALARALVSGRGTVLFDEPLSNVDARMRDRLRVELVALQRELGFAAVYVTHDQREAMSIAHRVVILEGGGVAQAGTPREIYARPASRYVAAFVGAENQHQGTVRSATRSSVRCATALGEVLADRSAGPAGDEPAVPASGDDVVAVFRPEHVRLSPTAADGPNCWPGLVQVASYVGERTEYVVNVNGQLVYCWVAGEPGFGENDTVWIHVPPSLVHVFAAAAPGGPDDAWTPAAPANPPAAASPVSRSASVN
jgi:iron(III) transport system ATP-binding protein